MRKIYHLTWVILFLFNCSSDDLQKDLESINYSCCGPNPFANTNVNNLDQSRGEIEFFGFATPNDDGINDAWGVKNLKLYEDFILEIFDLEENLVFQVEGSNPESSVFFPQKREFQDKDRVFRYKLVIEYENTFLNQGYFCLFTGMKKKSGGICTSVFPDPILD